MSAQLSHIPSRSELVNNEKAIAQLYLREFNPKNYSMFYSRIADPYGYLDEIGIDKICELIEHGRGHLNVAEILDISSGTLRKWIDLIPAYREKALFAKHCSGDGFAYKAERVLLEAKGGSKEDILIATKLADHYRWMASRLDKETFGDSKKLDEKSILPMVVNMNFGAEIEKTVVSTQTGKLSEKDILSLSHLGLADE